MIKWFSILMRIVKQENWLETCETRLARLAGQLETFNGQTDALREKVAGLEKTLEEFARKAEEISQTVSVEIENQNEKIESVLSLCRRQVEACTEIAKEVSGEINGLSEKIQMMNG